MLITFIVPVLLQTATNIPQKYTTYSTPLAPSAKASCKSVRFPAFTHKKVAEETFMKYCRAVHGVHKPSFVMHSHEPLVVYAVMNPRRAHGSLFFDIGANGGVYSIIALSTNFSGAIAFEPQVMCADNILFSKENNLQHLSTKSFFHIYNVGLGKPGTLVVYDKICGMNWQNTKNSASTAKVQSVSLSTILPSVHFPTDLPVFLKIDTDGAEVGIVEMLLEIFPYRGSAVSTNYTRKRLQMLPEVYLEVDPLYWNFFGHTDKDGIRVLSALGELYSEIYFFDSGLVTSCEGAGNTVLRFTESPKLVPEHPLKNHKHRILRVTDFGKMLHACVAHRHKQSHLKGNIADWGQMNLWFVPNS